MVSKSTDSAPKFKKSHGEQSKDGLASLSHKLNQLKKKIQSERHASIKERVENNRQKLESHLSELVQKTSERDSENNGSGNMLLSRMENPPNRFSGYARGYGEKDYITSHEVIFSPSTKLPYVEKLPPYTTWIFLDRNQRMAEDQSVVGRRRIYYDQHGSEALVCSDSEDDIVEPEEEKYEFSEGEDRLLWLAIEENGPGDEVISILRHFVGGTPLEIQERYKSLKEKYTEKSGPDVNNSVETNPDRGICLYKSLSAALDSFDNLFYRRCLHFDCRMHGCSQTLIYPTERQPYWSEHEENTKPCGVHCYLQLQANCDLPGISNSKAPGIRQDENSISGEMLPGPSENICDSQTDKQISHLGASISEMDQEATVQKRKVSKEADFTHHDSVCTNGDPNEPCKKQKIVGSPGALNEVAAVEESSKKQNIVGSPGALNEVAAVEESSKKQNIVGSPGALNEAAPVEDNTGYRKDSHLDCGSSNEDELQMTNKQIDALKNPEDIDKGYGKSNEFNSSLSSTKSQSDANLVNGDWKPVEKELYLKGLEIFGRNSCLIARNLLSGLRTCEEVFRYMHNGGTSMPNRSLALNQHYPEDDTECIGGETPTRSRLFRRKGKSRKIKYSWKSAGHPSIWKRIADGKNQSCKQYTPCGCQSMCGKQCPCLHNGTTCEKYCGCSKSCKNRFRGCHCAKSQCRSRQCPCFAAGRECDPDVCRNCWVSCGDSSLGEPPRRGDGQCGNMRLLLRQQQRILLARSDVAGWGAFLKNSVNKNDYLGEYTGELISHREADKRGKIYDRANSSFLFDLNDQYVLDAYRKGDKLKFANHSSNPNCYAKVMLVAGDHRVGIFAKERIEAGEELFYDYRYGPDQAPAWARKPEGSKRDESTAYPGRAKKHQSH